MKHDISKPESVLKDRVAEQLARQYQEFFNYPEAAKPVTFFHQVSMYDYSQHTYMSNSTSANESETKA